MLFQVKVESQPHSNGFKLKLKCGPPDQAVLATVELIPTLGGVKARALLKQFPSRIFLLSLLFAYCSKDL